MHCESSPQLLYWKSHDETAAPYSKAYSQWECHFNIKYAWYECYIIACDMSGLILNIPIIFRKLQGVGQQRAEMQLHLLSQGIARHGLEFLNTQQETKLE